VIIDEINEQQAADAWLQLKEQLLSDVKGFSDRYPSAEIKVRAPEQLDMLLFKRKVPETRANVITIVERLSSPGIRVFSNVEGDPVSLDRVFQPFVNHDGEIHLRTSGDPNEYQFRQVSAMALELLLFKIPGLET
jgi:hypothetical protein